MKTSIKLILAGTFGVFLIVLGIALSFLPSNPLDKFSTRKTCTFLVMPDISRAICTDGTAYDVVQIGSPAPLP